jgi:hypothetical protein
MKPGVSGPQKEKIITEIRKLPQRIPNVLETYVGMNVSPRGQGYEIGGVMRFSDEAALQAYTSHPAHQELLSWLMPLIEPIEVDFPV